MGDSVSRIKHVKVPGNQILQLYQVISTGYWLAGSQVAFRADPAEESRQVRDSWRRNASIARWADKGAPVTLSVLNGVATLTLIVAPLRLLHVEVLWKCVAGRGATADTCVAAFSCPDEQPRFRAPSISICMSVTFITPSPFRSLAGDARPSASLTIC